MKMDRREVDVDLAMKRFLNLPEGTPAEWGKTVQDVQIGRAHV